MSVILIDYPKVIDREYKAFHEKIGKPEKSRIAEPGLLLVLEKDGEKMLEKKEKKILEEKKFIDNILFSDYFFLCTKKNLCIFSCNEKYMKYNVLPKMEGELKRPLWTCVPISEKNFSACVEYLSKNGFTNPYITTTTPLKKSIQPSLALVRDGKGDKPDFVVKKALYVLEEYKKAGNACKIHARFSKNAVTFLKSASTKKGMVTENGKTSQREITGELYPKDIEYKEGMFIHVIDVNKDSVESGEEEAVSVAPTRYNFHSHPEEAYIRHSVTKAWPSVTDYLGYRKLGTQTIFHVVATIEGVYIISFGAHWCKNIKSVPESFVDKNYDINHKEPHTPEEYVKIVNKILYKGYPVYNVQYIGWKNIGNVFDVVYSKTGESCMATQKTVEAYKEHSRR
jgi:hypothetical protein